MPSTNRTRAFTLIELLVVIAIIAILAVVVVLTLNPAQLLAQSRDANRVSDMATLQSALNLYTTDQAGASSFNLGRNVETYISVPDTTLSGTATSTCSSLNLSVLPSGDNWRCASSVGGRAPTSTGWLPVNFSRISAGSPFGSLPVDPVNQTSSGLFYTYNTNGSQFEVTANLESQKYKQNYGANPQTAYFPEVVSGGTPGVSALYNNTGLVGWWPLTEGAGTSAVDQSGSGDNGTWGGNLISGSHYTTGRVGAFAGNFDGTTDNIDLGTNSILQPSTLTITAWVNFNAVSSIDTIMALGFDYGGNKGIWFCGNPSSGMTQFFYEVGNGSSITYHTTINEPAGWAFVALVYQPGATTTIYYQGAPVASWGSSPAVVYQSTHNMIGDDYVRTNWYASGSVNDVRLYNRALSAAEIQALYNAEK